MIVTANLFDAYLRCATKCFMRASGGTGTGNPYAGWTHARALAYHREGVARIQEGIAHNECINGPLDRKRLKSAEWRLAINVNASAQDLESAIHAVEQISRTACWGRGEIL